MDLIQAISEAVRLLRSGEVEKVLILAADDERAYEGPGVVRCDEIVAGTWFVLSGDGIVSSREPTLKW